VYFYIVLFLQRLMIGVTLFHPKINGYKEVSTSHFADVFSNRKFSFFTDPLLRTYHGSDDATARKSDRGLLFARL